MYEIEALNVKKSFGDLEVLKGVSLNVAKGEVINVKTRVASNAKFIWL